METEKIDVILKKIKRQILEKQHEVIDGALRDEVVSVSSIEYVFQKYGIEINGDDKF